MFLSVIYFCYSVVPLLYVGQNTALARPSSLLIKSITPPLSGQSGRGPSELASVSQPSEREELRSKSTIDRSKEMEETTLAEK